MESSLDHVRVVAKLRMFVCDWLAQIRQARAAFSQANIPGLHADYPLPESFPFGDFIITHRFLWVEIDGQAQFRHCYRVYFWFHGFSSEPWIPLVWSICSGAPLSSRACLPLLTKCCACSLLHRCRVSRLHRTGRANIPRPESPATHRRGFCPWDYDGFCPRRPKDSSTQQD